MKLLLLTILLCGISTAETAKDRMLREVVKNTVSPGYSRLAETCRSMADAAELLEKMPDVARLEQARATWLAATLSSRKLDCFKIGPITNAGDASAFYFLPVRAASIERAIQGDGDLQQLGAAAKGLFSMEYLLFPKEGDALARLSDDPKRRHYLFLIAREISSQANRLAKAWQEPYAESAKRFLSGGQTSLNALVNQMAMTTDAVALSAPPMPGSVSGHSDVLLQATVEGLHLMHSGGLNEYTRRLNPALADRVDKEFAATKKEISAESRNSLNVLHKVDLPSTLGVTLTFISTDGD